jgi:diguanylate cyclase (GGDEF)-like protein
VLLLPHASATEATHAAQRISDEFKQASAALLNRAEGVTMSIGIGSLSHNRPAGADQLVAKADAALYDAKAQGRDRIACAEEAPMLPPNAPTPSHSAAAAA